MIVSGSLLNLTRLPARCAAEASCVLSCGVVVPAEGAQRAELAPIFAPPHKPCTVRTASSGPSTEARLASPSAACERGRLQTTTEE